MICQDNYYAHPERYYPIFHEKIAPHASVIGENNLHVVAIYFLIKSLLISIWFLVLASISVNCIYWESRFPRLLTNGQLQSVVGLHNRLIGVADISCDIGGSIECVKRTTSSENPFYRYDFFQSLTWNLEYDYIFMSFNFQEI